MLFFYIHLTSAFVIPLLTLSLLGATTRVHRKSGAVGLAVGTLYGVCRLLTPVIAQHFGLVFLPTVPVNSYAAYPFSMVLTALTMLLVSSIVGWEPRQISLVREEQSAWLRTIKLAVKDLAQINTDGPDNSLPTYLTIGAFAVECTLTFVVFW